MMLIVGTVPARDLPLTMGVVSQAGDSLVVDGQAISCTQGTGAMISAALATTDYLKIDPPHVLVAGDTGQGRGSRDLYQYLIDHILEICPRVLSLHYCLPDMALTRRLCDAVGHCARRPVMIADAASMYAAKAAGLAGEFDVFTPDASEMAFLADPDAFHPAYIARHLFDTEAADIPSLVEAAYERGGASKLLLVKGAIDYVARDGQIVETIAEPNVPALEAIGGTGDTITGMVSAFAYAELELHEAAIIAARANRTAGELAEPTPATTVREIIGLLGPVYKEHLCEWSGVCCGQRGQE